MMPGIHKVGLLVLKGGSVLLCEQHDHPAQYILPGGKMESGETELECLARELREELGDVTAVHLVRLGEYHHHTADDPPRPIRIDLYSGTLVGSPEPHAEIARLVWFGESGNPALLPPSLRDVIFPDLIARGILPWKAMPAGPRGS